MINLSKKPIDKKLQSVIYKDKFVIKVNANSPSEKAIKTFQKTLLDVIQLSLNPSLRIKPNEVE
ncbi:hypothetical protein [Peribacillus tepidiphilus]|jgi:hypothetical protein|uniref:hypothetical protein n=1 Tax=Peribacillus tepidiphilus TaxID=2652445 RepID=UPI00129204D1|nr:hypothetical protein [Peribacillus tepidiphilus]